jgi:hypothetical protein
VGVQFFALFCDIPETTARPGTPFKSDFHGKTSNLGKRVTDMQRTPLTAKQI